MIFPTGHIESPLAEAHRIAERPLIGLVGDSMAGIGAEQDFRVFAGEVDEQLGNSCCWDASGAAMEGTALAGGAPLPRLSRKQMWVFAQLRDQQRRGIPLEQRRARNVGSSIDMGCLALREHGIVSDARCPFEPGDFVAKADGELDIQIPIDVDMAAADALLTGDYGVEAALAFDVLRIAMQKLHFGIIAIDVDQAFMELVGPDAEYDGASHEVLGGHAMAVFGSRPRVGSSPAALLVKNSYGKDWGDQGYFWLTDRAVRFGRDAAVFTTRPRVAA